MLLSTVVFGGTATIRFLDKIPCPLFNVLEVSPSAALCSCRGTLSVATDFCGPAGRTWHQDPHLSSSLDGSPPVLAGAAVEGPNRTTSRGLVSGMITCPANGVDQFAQFNGSSATFQDNVQSWSTDEPAIDLTASSPLAFAWQMQP